MRNCLIVLCILCSSGLFAQRNFTFGWLPEVNISYKIDDAWSVVGNVEARQSVYSENEDASQFDYNYLLTDISGIVSYKLGYTDKISGGYLLRVRDQDLVHRFIQQYSWVSNKDFFRIGHRFVTDQTFDVNDSFTFRTRYRISFEFPLNGQKVDTKEFYIKASNEYLGIFEEGDNDLEVRLVPALGYVFSKNNKIELGLDYRLSEFVAGETAKNRLWTTMSLFLPLK